MHGERAHGLNDLVNVAEHVVLDDSEVGALIVVETWRREHCEKHERILLQDILCLQVLHEAFILLVSVAVILGHPGEEFVVLHDDDLVSIV